jgi:signal transduction histidine kinase
MPNVPTRPRDVRHRLGATVQRTWAVVDAWIELHVPPRVRGPASRARSRPAATSTQGNPRTSRVDAVAEQLQRANEELLLHGELRRHFLAMASHELRTPLTAIAGFASTMTHMWDELPEAEKRKFVGIISEQADRLTGLVEDIFIVTRLEAGDFPVHPREIDVLGPIQDIVRQLDLHDVTIDCDDHLLIYADPQHLRDILVRLLSNAVQHGQPPITISAHATNGSADISVTDSGEGVPAEFIPYLFTKFAQAPDITVPDPSGTGLGLAVVRGLATALGGIAWYEPGALQGSTFGVRLPTSRDRRIGPPNRRT